MAVRHNSYLLNTNAAIPVAFNANDMGRDYTLVFTNESLSDIYIGDSHVSASDYGYVLKQGETWTVTDVNSNDVFSCIAAAGSPVLHVLAYNA